MWLAIQSKCTFTNKETMKAIGKGYNACGLLPIFWPTFQMVAMDVKVKTSLFE
jgi:hypothetical protein